MIEFFRTMARTRPGWVGVFIVGGAIWAGTLACCVGVVNI